MCKNKPWDRGFVTIFGTKTNTVVKVSFHYADRQLRLTGKKRLKLFILSLFEREKQPLKEIHYIFCSDEYLLGINRDFLQHDYYTDIISFELGDPQIGSKGEIYISLDRVKDNAKMHHSVYTEELLRVIFHGALHLCGYKDKSKADIQQMRAKEQEYLHLYQTSV